MENYFVADSEKQNYKKITMIQLQNVRKLISLVIKIEYYGNTYLDKAGRRLKINTYNMYWN